MSHPRYAILRRENSAYDAKLIEHPLGWAVGEYRLVAEGDVFALRKLIAELKGGDVEPD